MNHPLGQGAFGKVCLAMQYPAGRPVAVKIFGCRANHAECAAEFETLLRLRAYRHVVTVLHYEIVGDTAYMFMELLACSVADVITGSGGLAEECVQRYMQQAAAGLESLRMEGIVHRDIKPANMMVAHDGTLQLADFGLSPETIRHASPALLPVGTPAFWAPELLHGEPHSHASDVWALACSAVSMLSGERPHKGSFDTLSSPVQYAARLGAGDFVPQVPAHTSPSLAALLRRCFAADPAARPQLDELGCPFTYEVPAAALAATNGASVTINNDDCGGMYGYGDSTAVTAASETVGSTARSFLPAGNSLSHS
jgi:serine/threonine protein kinase